MADVSVLFRSQSAHDTVETVCSDRVVTRKSHVRFPEAEHASLLRATFLILLIIPTGDCMLVTRDNGCGNIACAERPNDVAGATIATACPHIG